MDKYVLNHNAENEQEISTSSESSTQSIHKSASLLGDVIFVVATNYEEMHMYWIRLSPLIQCTYKDHYHL